MVVPHVLCPEAGLVANDVLGAEVRQGIYGRVVAVYFLEGHEDLLGGLVVLVFLLVVKIAPAVGGEHYAYAPLYAAGSGCVTAVRHCNGVVKGASVQDFVPADDGFAVLAQEVSHSLHKEGLELFFRLNSKHFHEVLAVLALLVDVFGCLVSADVIDVVREEVEELGEYVFQEGEGFGRGSIEVLPNAPAGLYLIMPLREAAELGIGGDGGCAVAGDFNLRNNIYAAPAGVFHYFTDIVFGVEAAVGLSVADAAVPGGFLAPGAHLGELGILVYLYAPALVFREVPVELVLLVHGHEVDELHQLLLGEEEASGVEQEAAVPELGLVVNGAAGDRPFLDSLCLDGAVNLCGKQLQQRLEPVEGAVHLGCLYEHAIRLYIQPVCLFGKSGNFAEGDGRAFSVKLKACGSCHLGGEIFCDFAEQGVLYHQVGLFI